MSPKLTGLAAEIGLQLPQVALELRQPGRRAAEMGQRAERRDRCPSTARPFETRLTLVIAVAVAAAWRVTELVTLVPEPDPSW